MAVAGFDVVFQNCCIAVFKSEGIETFKTPELFLFVLVMMKKKKKRMITNTARTVFHFNLTYHLVPLNYGKVGIKVNSVPLSIIMLSPGKC
uniref:Uncharacterized protein n=1 Tax=Cyprinus carpio TaxID=7962 RepID=A0A8C1VFA1_CYPCA